jgi:hypothetical protein
MSLAAVWTFFSAGIVCADRKNQQTRHALDYALLGGMKYL